MVEEFLLNCKLIKLFTIDNILKILLQLEKDKKLTVRELGRRINVNYTLSRQIDILTQHTLIKKGEPGKKNIIELELTEKGIAFLHTLKVTCNSLNELDKKYI